MPSKPDYVDRELELIAGRNVFGGLNLRIVWGADQRDHRGNPKYIHPSKNVPMECWVLERWVPPGFFGGKEAWEEQRYYYDDRRQVEVDLRGDYPTRGAYVMLRPIVNRETEEYLPLDRQVLDTIRRTVREDEEFASLSDAMRNRVIREHEDAREKAKEYETEKTMSDVREYHLRNWDAIDRAPTRGYSITPR